jgi:hypothetical protein
MPPQYGRVFRRSATPGGDQAFRRARPPAQSNDKGLPEFTTVDRARLQQRCRGPARAACPPASAQHGNARSKPEAASIRARRCAHGNLKRGRERGDGLSRCEIVASWPRCLDCLLWACLLGNGRCRAGRLRKRAGRCEEVLTPCAPAPTVGWPD